MDELEKLLAQLQNQNQQLQAILIQKQALTVHSKETESALKELEKCEEIYKSVGPILVKTNKEEMRKELIETKEDLELKIKALEKQESRIRQKIKDSQEKFQELMKQQPVGG